MHCRLQCAEDVGVGVVAHAAGEDPAGAHIGQVQRAGELTFERWPAVRDGVAFEEPRDGLDLIGAVRILTEDRSNGDGLVVDAPLIWSTALAGPERSIVALLIANSSARTAGP